MLQYHVIKLAVKYDYNWDKLITNLYVQCSFQAETRWVILSLWSECEVNEFCLWSELDDGRSELDDGRTHHNSVKRCMYREYISMMIKKFSNTEQTEKIMISISSYRTSVSTPGVFIVILSRHWWTTSVLKRIFRNCVCSIPALHS